MDKICVIGARGHGREILEILRDINSIDRRYEITGFFDDDPGLAGCDVDGYPVLGGTDDIIPKFGSDHMYVLGIGSPDVKKKIVGKLAECRLEWPVIIHPSARIPGDARLGRGVVVFPYCVLSVNVSLGEFVCVNTLASISHDVTVGDYTTVSPGSIINGTVKIGAGTCLGTGSVVINNKNVGARCMIGAGSVVVDDIPDDTKALGVPARPKEKEIH